MKNVFFFYIFINSLSFVNCQVNDTSYFELPEEHKIKNYYSTNEKITNQSNIIDSVYTNIFLKNENHTQFTDKIDRNLIYLFNDENLLVIESLGDLSKKMVFLTFELEVGYNNQVKCYYKNDKEISYCFTYVINENNTKKLTSLEVSDEFDKSISYLYYSYKKTPNE
jgi:hypothetical protein